MKQVVGHFSPLPDENCGFRPLALAITGNQEQYKLLKAKVIAILNKKNVFYQQIFGNFLLQSLALSTFERLALSSISITNTAKLPKFKLSGSSYELVERWKKAIEENAKVFLQLPHPTNAEEMAIANTLSTL
ncbi:hypothetical protein HMPREF1544_11677 [Mucor circinelloides 1006PhL]|uniref:Uncharacterized protein n=1 Tax=Mucor circinelloides f. circinelloides (strain 1006PhL) TaxID=1220926 RepID=S2IWC4_MUCC1|nr:hypothetical protein HMPREF1544_11677 [Mucor circinelloides 1006PhL]